VKAARASLIPCQPTIFPIQANNPEPIKRESKKSKNLPINPVIIEIISQGLRYIEQI